MVEAPTNRYRIDQDVRLIQELLSCSRADLSSACGVSVPTLDRWAAAAVEPSHERLDTLYSHAFKSGLRLNRIKEQLYREDAHGAKVLFHGAKTCIDGPIALDRSREANDFGKGFYCGETFEQASMFVARYPQSSVYAFEFRDEGLQPLCLGVERDWMLTVAYCRGKLSQYADSKIVKSLVRRLEAADYVVAPIADNRMFEIIDSFVDGEITDEQCRHCLSATDLGMQYVFKTKQALDRLAMLERCYLCEEEKKACLEARAESSKIGQDKVKVARRQYRGQGRYIEELLDEQG